MSVLVIGSLALDSIRTPHGEVNEALGGSCSYASMSASYFSDKVSIVGVVGSDFSSKHLAMYKKHNIDASGVQVIKGGKTFRWSGYYEFDMAQAHTLETQLNVFADFKPQIPENLRKSEFVLLGNIHPALQLDVLSQIHEPKLKLVDTMNFWIDGYREDLLKVLKRCDVILLNDAEARQLCATPNLQKAARELLKMGPSRIIIKKGENGCLMFSKDSYFCAPAFPLSMLKDPTGAGDTFAGGFIGYLAGARKLDEATFRKAVIAGTAMASFTVEEFSLKRLANLKREEIAARCEKLRDFTAFPKVVLK